MDRIMKYGITFVACFDEESNQKIKNALQLINKYRICKVPIKNGNRKDIDTLPFHSTLSAWKISEEPTIVEKIRDTFAFQSFTTDFRIRGKNTLICLEPIQEEQLRALQTQAYNLKPSEKYDPSSYYLHGTLNINPDWNQIQEQIKIFKNVILNLKIIKVCLFEIYPAELVCSFDENGFHLFKNVRSNLPKELSSYQQIIKRNENKPFEGIISCLKGSVKVFASTICNDDEEKYGPLNVINKDSNNIFSSKDEKNSWLIYDFCNHRINIECYEIKSSDSIKGSSHMKTWNIEGSNNYEEWYIIDMNKECEYLNDSNATHKFNIPNNSHNFYRFIRIRETGPNWKNKHFLKFKQIEFYGTVIEL